MKKQETNNISMKIINKTRTLWMHIGNQELKLNEGDAIKSIKHKNPCGFSDIITLKATISRIYPNCIVVRDENHRLVKINLENIQSVSI